MAVLIFGERFASAVATGTKQQTIRPSRPRGIREGHRFSLRKWENKAYRSRQVELREAICTQIGTIEIDESFREFKFIVDGQRLTQDQWAKLARDDGFDCTTDMLDWFRKTYGLPFEGFLIQWQ